MIYLISTPTCAKCKVAKKLIEDNKLSIIVTNALEDTRAAAWMSFLGISTVPVLVSYTDGAPKLISRNENEIMEILESSVLSKKATNS